MEDKNQEFLLNTIKLFLANTMVFAISALSVPVVSRLYSPADFGDAAYFMSVIGIIASISSLRYDASIVLTDSSKEARVMLLASALICLLVSIIAWTAATLLHEMNPGWIAPIGKYLGIFPLAIFLSGFSQIMISFLSRYKRFSQIGTMNTSKVVVQQLYRIALGAAGFASALQMILSVLMGLILSLALTAKYLRTVVNKMRADRIRLKELRHGIRRYKNFPLYSSWTYFINILGIQLPFLVVGKLFGIEKVGYFSAAVILLGVPQLFSSAIGQVLYQRSVAAKSEGNLAIIVFEIYKRLIIYGIFPFGLIAIYGPELTTFVLGERWATSGRYAQLLSSVYFCIFFSSPLGHLYNILGLQRINLRFNFFRLLTQILSLMIGGLLGNIYIALLGYSVSGSIFRYSSISWVLSRSGIDLISNVIVIIKAASLSLVPLLLIKAIETWLQLSPGISIVAISGAALGYYATNLANDTLAYGVIKDRFRRLFGNT